MRIDDLSDADLLKVLKKNALVIVSNRYIPDKFNHIGLPADIFTRGKKDAKHNIKTIEIEIADLTGMLG